MSITDFSENESRSSSEHSNDVSTYYNCSNQSNQINDHSDQANHTTTPMQPERRSKRGHKPKLRCGIFGQLKNCFDLKVIGLCKWFLGLHIQYDYTRSYLN